MIETILVALVAGVIGGLLSRYIPTFFLGSGEHNYEVRRGSVVLYVGHDLRKAKARRKANPGAVLIADGVNRG